MTTSPSEATTLRDRSGMLMTLLVTFIAAACLVYWRVLDNDLAGALNGYSPTTLMGDFWFKPQFAANYPGGEDELFKSFILQAYPVAGALGISRSVMFTVMTALEVLVPAAGAAFATLRLNPLATPARAVITGLMICAGVLVSANLARWGHPYYGSVYNYAYGAGLAGAALMLTTQPILGAALLGLTVAIHPLLGGLFGIFAGAGVLVAITRYRWRDLILAALVGIGIGGGWLLWTLRGAAVGGGTIPATDFIAITKVMGYHWYPITQGIFGRIAYERFAPFLSFMILIAIYFGRERRALTLLERQIFAGMAALAMTTCIGIVAAEYSGIPFLVKLALHRASAVLLLVGGLFVAPGLLRDLAEGPWWRAILAAVVLAFCFFSPFGVPVTLALILGGAVLVEQFLARRVRGALVTVLLLVAVAAIYLLTSGNAALTDGLYTGLTTLMSPPTLIAIATLAAARFIVPRLSIPVAIAVLAMLWAPTLAQFGNDQQRDKARAYLAVQNWARQNTPVNALFMPDPGVAYGWREFSERPSFGSVREWLYAGWLYNSQRAVFDDGLERVEFLGYPIEKILAQDSIQPDYAKSTLPVDLQNFYYAQSVDWFKVASQRFGIDYFVFDQSHAQDVPGMTVVYANAYYSVRQVAP